MKRIVSAALAVAIGFGSVATVTSTASADWKGPKGGNWGQPGGNWGKPGNWHGYKPYPQPYPYPYRYNNNGWNAGAGFAVGALLGLGIGAIATAPRNYGPTYYAQPVEPYPYVTVSQAHVRWCLSQYRSYNPATNTYTGYDGYQHVCVGP